MSKAFYVHIVIKARSYLHFDVDGLHWKIIWDNFRFEVSEQKPSAQFLCIPTCGLAMLAAIVDRLKCIRSARMSFGSFIYT